MNSTKSKTTNLALCGIMILICLAGGWFGGKMLIAEYHFESAKGMVEIWGEQGAIYQVDQWNQAVEHIGRAIDLNNSRAEFHLYKAFVYEWGIKAPFPADQQLSPSDQLEVIIERVELFRRNALQAYRDSLSQRPASAQSWIGYTDTKGQLDEFDDEFVHAYVMANQHASNLPYYHGSLAFLVGRYFKELNGNEETRSVLMDYLARNIAGNGGPGVLDYLARFRELDVACRMFLDEALAMTEAVRSRCETVLQ